MSSQKWGQKGGHFALAFCLSVFSGANAVADDTEIYFGAASSGTIKPNILFVMDTSGSMDWNVVRDDSSTPKRMPLLKEALNEILDSVDNVNVGIMRYSASRDADGSGGPVLYPVTYIDSLTGGVRSISSSVVAQTDDASESVVSPYSVALTEVCLPVSKVPTPVVPSLPELANGVAVSSLSGAQNTRTDYTIRVPPGASSLVITTQGGSGQVDIYGNLNFATDNRWANCIGDRSGTNETCEISPAPPGLYYIRLKASRWSGYSGVTLRATHDAPVCSSSGERKVGLRFAGLEVPQGATITRAYLEVGATEDTSAATSLTIKAHKVSNSATFTAAATDISARPATTASVSWAPSSWAQGLVYASPDLRTVVQEVVNQAGWCGGNAISLLLSGTGSRAISSFESGVNSPRLVVEFDDASAAGGCVTRSFVRQVSATQDDAFQNSSGAVTRDSTLDFKTNYWLGSRFQNIEIPQGATILSANLELKANNTVSGSVTASVTTQNADNAAAFSTANYDLSGRAQTAAASWSLAGWNRDVAYSSPDLKSQIQTVVSRAGWASGNSLVLLTKVTGFGANTTATRKAYGVDTSASSAAKLYVTYQGGYQAATVRSDLKATVNNLSAKGSTPISGTLAEAALYMRGEAVNFGKERGPGHDSNYRTSHPGSYTGGVDVLPAGCPGWDSSNANCADEVITGSPRYRSPMTETCQSNHILFLSDGEPNSHGANTAALIAGITGQTCSAENWTSSDATTYGDNGSDCSKKLASFLSSNDQSDSLPGNQPVIVHTIAFGSKIKLMEDIALAGKGIYAQADDKAELLSAFEAVVKTAMDTNSSFVSAGITVNQSNRLTNADQLYFSLFNPKEQPAWPGNLKRYRLDESGVIRDYNTLAAVGDDGKFDDDAQSWWSANKDGNEVGLGGAAEQMALPRKVYTNVNAAESNLTHSTNAVSDSNALITTLMLSAADSTERTKILSWAKGVDVMDADGDGSTTDVRQQMGDPLHSRPTLVSFASGAGSRNLIFVGTNQGYLHAIDTTNGQEQWAFIPKELLGNLSTYMNNVGGSRPYGLDGQISFLHVDGNNNHLVDTNETAILYVGMRRGGKNYYAIDVSNPDAPKIKFVIQGGIAATDYEELGQTWSQAKPRKIKWNGAAKQVIIFGGGYDPAQDTAGTAPVNDSQGRTVFIADALTGARLWSARAHAVAPPSPGTAATGVLTAAIPADVTTIDLSGDGLIDVLYASDLAGQVFRFDLNDANSSASNFAVGGRIAHLNANTVAGNRRFFYAPDVALVSRSGDSGFLAVSLGSGYRAHPLNTQTHEHFYMLKDYGALRTTVSSGRTVRQFRDYGLDNLVDVSLLARDDAANAAIDAAALADPDDNGGWYINFAQDRGNGTMVGGVGEKTVAQSLTVNDTIIFSTYVPPPTIAGACVPKEGTGRLYFVDILNGTPIARMIADVDNPNIDERHTTDTTGMPTGPLAMFTENEMLIIEGRNVYEAPPSPAGEPIEVYRRTQTRNSLYTDGDIPTP